MKLQDFIVEWVAHKTSFRVEATKNLFENIAFDSLTFSQLISAIEEEFDVELSFTEVDDWSTLLTPMGLAEYILLELDK